MKQPIKFITFSDGSVEYRAAGIRLADQAIKSGWFTDVEVFNDERLREFSEPWYAQNANFLHNNQRGFGYWIWKAYIISECLKKIPKGSFLVYADAGFEINPSGTTRFFEYIKLAQEFDLLGFEVNHSISTWTKGDLLEYFGIDKKSPILNLNQIQSGLLVIKATSKNITIMNSWSEISSARSYSLIDDSKSSSQNCANFIEHRHDQSILTLILRTTGNGFFIPIEDYYLDLFSNGLYPIDMPFLALRNRTGVSRLN